jgi:uncharacterized protein YbjT (DUF2867 family)
VCGANVRALVRDPAKARERLADPVSAGGAAELGDLEIVTGALDDADAVAEAAGGMDAAFLALGSVGEQGELQHRVIQTLAAAGLPRLVRLSVLSTGHASPGLNQRGHAVLDDVVADTGLAYTSLRPVIFMTGVLDAAAQIRRDGSWLGTAAHGRNPLIDPRDVAATAVAVLLDPGGRERHYELTGPRLYSWPDVAEALTRELGRTVKFVAVDEATMRERLAGQVTESGVDLLVTRERAVEAGDNERLTGWVHKLTGAAPRTVEAFTSPVPAARYARPTPATTTIPDRAAALPPPSCSPLASLCLTFEHREVMNQLIHGGAGLRRELLGRRIVHSRGGAAESVGAPR